MTEKQKSERPGDLANLSTRAGADVGPAIHIGGYRIVRQIGEGGMGIAPLVGRASKYVNHELETIVFKASRSRHVLSAGARREGPGILDDHA